jgi:hypothetical protein
MSLAKGQSDVAISCKHESTRRNVADNCPSCWLCLAPWEPIIKNDNSYHYDKCHYYSGKAGGNPAPPSPPIQLNELPASNPPPTNIPSGIQGHNEAPSRLRTRKNTLRRPANQDPPLSRARAPPAASTPPNTTFTGMSRGSDHQPTRRLIRTQASAGRLKTPANQPPPAQRARSHSPVPRNSEIPASNSWKSQSNPRPNAALRGARLNSPHWAPNRLQSSSAVRNVERPAYPPTNQSQGHWASLVAALPPVPPRVERGAAVNHTHPRSQYSANPQPSSSTGYSGGSSSVNNWLRKIGSSQQQPLYPPANGAAASLARERDRTVSAWLRSRGYAS